MVGTPPRPAGGGTLGVGGPGGGGGFKVLEDAPPSCVPFYGPPNLSEMTGGGAGLAALPAGCATFGGVVSTRAFARLLATLITPVRPSWFVACCAMARQSVPHPSSVWTGSPACAHLSSEKRATPGIGTSSGKRGRVEEKRRSNTLTTSK